MIQAAKPFKIKENESALKNFAKKYSIDGRIGYGPKSFIKATEEAVKNLLKNNRETKVKIALRCTMQKTDPPIVTFVSSH